MKRFLYQQINPEIYIKLKQKIYRKLLHDNITTTYKKADQRKINNINRDAKKIVVDLDLEDRNEKMQESESYTTVKDHKEDFPIKYHVG